MTMTTWILLTTLMLFGAAVLGLLLATLGRIDRITWADAEEAGPADTARVDAGLDLPSAVEIPTYADTHEGAGFRYRSTDRAFRMLVVDDDPNLRALLRTSFELAEIEVDEADSVKSAAQKIASAHPDVIVLDVAMPGTDGITFCRGLKADPFTRAIPVILLTGDPISESSGRAAGAEAFLRKPFSPLELLTVSERLGAANGEQAHESSPTPASDEQLALYAQDFRRLLELERGQRILLQDAYRETVVALARALESKDGGTGAHSERVRLYADELTHAMAPSLFDEPGLEYGFILHDIGKIGSRSRAPQARAADGVGAAIDRDAHGARRADGRRSGSSAGTRGSCRSLPPRALGRPGISRPAGADDIPLGARIFSIADALDAITSDRPYRPASTWEEAAAEIAAGAGTQFDPEVVDVFREREEALQRIHSEFNISTTRPSPDRYSERWLKGVNAVPQRSDLRPNLCPGRGNPGTQVSQPAAQAIDQLQEET